jgi:5-methylcytosine-specific restriction endonuclease McrA
MSRIASSLVRERIEPEKRRAFRASDIAIAMQRQCDRCYDCGADEKLEADHNLPRDLMGKTDLANLVMRCKACHAAKTTQRDRPMIDKARRIRKKLDPPSSPSKQKRKIEGRGFSKVLSRGFDGKVKER